MESNYNCFIDISFNGGDIRFYSYWLGNSEKYIVIYWAILTYHKKLWMSFVKT